MSGRCGACTICCTIPDIAELGKPANTPCVHLTPQGCGIYETRPQVCRDFECDWLQMGGGDSSSRPDRIGFYATAIDNPGGLIPMGVRIHAHDGDVEAWKRSAKWRRIVERIVENGGSVFVIAGQKRRVITRDQRVLDVLKPEELP